MAPSELWWLFAPPTPLFDRNHSSTQQHSEFVSAAVMEQLASGASIRCRRDHITCISLLGVVPKAGDKHRLILDLSRVNKALRLPTFKYEGVWAIPITVLTGDFLSTLDLRAGYHHVPMHPGAMPFLGFEWEGNFYTFCVLLFGLASAPWAFTRITRLLVRRWRQRGARCIGYIDDFLLAGPSASDTAALVDSVRRDLAASGLLISE